ncbi:MAG: NUDIX domain-containing protein [Aeromicrobium sp.]|uniref:NUDIX hydrolase n=1 Tax=Aeromicrobium sp. TaxID=1871063 RepID=UPI003C5BC7C2
MNVIHVVAALITDPDGRMLTVRKQGTEMFMNPGGKPEVGESAVQALRRELVEEIGLDVTVRDLERIGTFTAPAANEPGHVVTAEVFRLRLPDPTHCVGAEIAESCWIDPRDPGDIALAPLAVDHLMRLL